MAKVVKINGLDIIDLGLDYFDACHGMQTGVKHNLACGGKSGEPKHLRVGINSAMSDAGALASLLIEKGLFTADEYAERIRLFMNNELAEYERKFPGYIFR